MNFHLVAFAVLKKQAIEEREMRFEANKTIAEVGNPKVYLYN